MKRYFIAFVFLIFSRSFFAQQNNVFVDLRSFYGVGIGRIHGIDGNYSNGLRVSIGKSLNPKSQEWIRFFGAENASLSFVYWDMTDMKYNNVSFGEVYGFTLSSEFNLLKDKYFRVFIAPEIGVGYATITVFNEPKSFVFGSHLNALFEVTLGTEINMNQNWKLRPIFTLQHLSNGAFYLPNFGSNAVNLGIEIRKEFKNREHSTTSGSKNLQLKKHGFEISLGVGRRGKYRQKGGFLRSGFYAGYNFFPNQMLGFRLGIDGVYYAKVYDPAQYFDSITYFGESWEHSRFGTSSGIEFRFGTVALNVNVGRYVYFKSPYNQKMYWNANLKYYLSPKLGIQGTLTSHKSQADFVNFGVFVRL